MQNPNEAKKTVSVPKKILVVVLGAVLVMVVGSVVWRATTGTHLRVTGHIYKLEVARTTAQQEKGLGYRDNMPADHGMLFLYAKPGMYCYWMKGMRFSLDIIWLNADKQIIKIEPDLTPASYPRAYCPAGPDSQYVIELDAGQAAATHMRLGQQLQF
jgi:uncharacterized membrane protein (UPF0127 family)